MAPFTTNPSPVRSEAPHQPSHFPDGLRGYIVRPGGDMVPLVPVDQLPFQLEGIPSKLSHSQLFSEHWVFCAEAGPLVSRFQVSAPAETLAPPKFYPPDHEVKKEAAQANRALPRTALPSYASAATQKPLGLPHRATTSESANRPGTSLADNFATIYTKDAERLGYKPHLPPPSGIEPDPTKKEYCTYWIKTGECSFTAQGCRYKHEMPSPQKLKEIGFNSVPQWWKEKSVLKRSTWMQRRMNPDAEEDGKVATHGAIPELVFKHRVAASLLKSEDAKRDSAAFVPSQETVNVNERPIKPFQVPQTPKPRPVTPRFDPQIDLIDLSDHSPRAPPSTPQSSAPSLAMDHDSVASSRQGSVSSASTPGTPTLSPPVLVSKTAQAKLSSASRRSSLSQDMGTAKRQRSTASHVKDRSRVASHAKDISTAPSHGLSKSRHAEHAHCYEPHTQTPHANPKADHQTRARDGADPRLQDQIEGLKRAVHSRKKKVVKNQKGVQGGKGPGHAKAAAVEKVPKLIE